MYLSEIVNKNRSIRKIETPQFEKEFDVIVCGLGTAGSLAALFSAENNLSVLGIETFTCVGGTHTVGGVPGNYFGCPGGRYEKLDHENNLFTKRYTYTVSESRKFLTEQKLNKQGVEILYEATVCGVYLEDSTVVGVRVLTTNGIIDCKAKIVMDCTAEAHVAAMAGCETEYGRETDRQTQPYSVVSLVYDGEKYGYNNVDFGRMNQLDQSDFSKAILYSRGYKMAEASQGKTMIAQMPLVGIREGRRIIAEETVSLKELQEERQTDTPMFYSYSDLDKHGWDIAFDSEQLGDWTIGANLGAYNVTVAVPYKAILPKGFDGILVPCRSLGVSRDISSCVRMNRDMKKVAEAAAEWAALSIKGRKKLREVSYAQLREKLMESGCLKESDNRGCRIDGMRNWDSTPLVPEDVIWISDESKLEDELKTEKPGKAIWSAKKMGAAAVPTLLKLLNSTDENTRKHAAFALAILKRDEGCEVLREVVIERDGLMLKDCRKNNQIRASMAIYWLGRLADRESVPHLIHLISDETENKREVYHQKGLPDVKYKISDYLDIYFQFMSQSVMALVRIGDAHADLRLQIEKAFKDVFSNDAYYWRITKRPEESSEGNAALTIKKIAFLSIENWHKQKSF